jgi:hypothetical protein
MLFALVMLILSAVEIVLGLFLYGNSGGEIPDRPHREPAAARKGLSRIPWKDLFASMKPSIKTMTNREASRTQRLAATGAFSVMVGLIVGAIALVAFIIALV